MDKLSINHCVYHIVYCLVDSCGGKLTRDWEQSVWCVLSLQCEIKTTESDYTGPAHCVVKERLSIRHSDATLLPSDRVISLDLFIKWPLFPPHYKRFMFTSCFLVSVQHQPKLLLKSTVFSPLLVPCGAINCAHCCLFIVFEDRPAGFSHFGTHKVALVSRLTRLKWVQHQNTCVRTIYNNAQNLISRGCSKLNILLIASTWVFPALNKGCSLSFSRSILSALCAVTCWWSLFFFFALNKSTSVSVNSHDSTVWFDSSLSNPSLIPNVRVGCGLLQFHANKIK